MKFILTIVAFTTCMIATSCGNDNAPREDNAMDSVGNPSTNPSSTSVLTEDSTQLKDIDSTHADSLKH